MILLNATKYCLVMKSKINKEIIDNENFANQ